MVFTDSVHCYFARAIQTSLLHGVVISGIILFGLSKYHCLQAKQTGFPIKYCTKEKKTALKNLYIMEWSYHPLIEDKCQYPYQKEWTK
jgi:hypothetical protein